MLGHDGAGIGSGWYVESVAVDIESHGRHLVFPCHRWLATDEDDGKIERELFPVEERVMEKSMLLFYTLLFALRYRQGCGRVWPGSFVFLVVLAYVSVEWNTSNSR